ncbi:hypothetical protein J2X01_000043 [Arthrobacter ginsengisoli]|uniref:Uncharacterized protein n=1 Tax=Arthrobacter ginsengisoli TaxID=1356565 RepID=A0ABU1U6G0_9MICC|nr:hypothetical protein [Arthrobacter ginsengisoli]MDR7080774.1 hypothetical protein [Arthrobacter ginsengisoli]
MTPSADPVEVFVQTGPAEWWQVLAALGPLAVLIAALIGAVISLRTLNQRAAADTAALAQQREADNRSEWWHRTQWALDSSLSADPNRAELGLGIMAVQAESELASPEELEIITVAWVDPLDRAPARPTIVPAPEAAAPGNRAASRDRGVQIAAAKLRLVTDRRLGRATPDWVKELAAAKHHGLP